MRLCLSVGGSITGEHGIGMEKIDFIPLMYSPDDLEAMRRVRATFDSSSRCNPGKLLPTTRSCAETHVSYRPHRIEREGLAQRY
jgi:glycolate oxidase